MSFLEELSKKGIIRADQVGDIKLRARDKYSGDIDKALEEIGISEDEILEARGEYLKVPIRKVDLKDMSFDVLKYISEDSATHYNFVPLEMKDGALSVGVLDPTNTQAMDALQFISAKLGVPFKVFLIAPSIYKSILESYKGINNQISEALDAMDDSQEVEKFSAENLDKEIKNITPGTEPKIVEDAPVIKIVAVMLRNAIEGNSSDIHIEPGEEKVKVRYRVDGALYTSIVLPLSVYSGVVARIKILAKLRLDEKRKPQDGSFNATIDGHKVSFRVSTMPSYYGEKVVLRILDSDKGVRPLSELGLSEVNFKMSKEALSRPYGIILVTGPTGSGKSTTLYSMMNELDKEKSNIVSLEDPVEYNMPGVNQSQVVPEIGYTFAAGLRSILRQDPDIIMIGEIRDKETAQLAVQAALTGHLVLSTLHTNNAVGAIPRLVDMGIDPYLIAPTLILSIAQRLAQMIHPTSRKAVPIDDSLKMQIDAQFKDLPDEYKKALPMKNEVYEAVSSPECPSGTKGRIAIFEMFKVDKDMIDVILKNPTSTEIYKTARRKGMLTMREDAILKCMQGIIPVREIYNFSNDNE